MSIKSGRSQDLLRLWPAGRPHIPPPPLLRCLRWLSPPPGCLHRIPATPPGTSSHPQGVGWGWGAQRGQAPCPALHKKGEVKLELWTPMPEDEAFLQSWSLPRYGCVEPGPRRSLEETQDGCLQGVSAQPDFTSHVLPPPQPQADLPRHSRARAQLFCGGRTPNGPW